MVKYLDACCTKTFGASMTATTKFTMKIIKLDKGGATGQHSESGLCKICMEDEICFVFIPCGHEITCEKCAMDGRLEN